MREAARKPARDCERQPTPAERDAAAATRRAATAARVRRHRARLREGEHLEVETEEFVR